MAISRHIGEDKLFVIMGALHIENKMHLMIGKLQHDTGWDIILSQAEVLTSGRAQSTLVEQHIKRTRSRLYRCTCSSRAHTYWQYCNNVMGPPESCSMRNERSQTVTKFPFMNYACTSELCCASWTVWSMVLN